MSDTSPTSAPGASTGQKAAAELLGTFVLVLAGCGAVVMSQGDYVAIALAFGLALLVGTYSFGRVSGAHFNPAVSIGAAVSGRMPWGQVPLYVGAQVLGATLAAGLLWVLVRAIPEGAVPESSLGQNFFGDGGFAWWGALVVEIVLTALLVTVILAVSDSRNEHPALAPLAIGMTLVVVHLVAIPLTGTSVNPARSVGPALFTGTESLQDLWLFVLAPVVGAAIAGLTYPAVFGHGTSPVPGSGITLGRPARLGAPGYGQPDQFQQEWQEQPQAAAAWEPEPIIQDGWQWDHQAQEWKPLEQWTTAADAQATSAAAGDAQHTEVLPQQSWDTPGTGGTGGVDDTQVRPRDV